MRGRSHRRGSKGRDGGESEPVGDGFRIGEAKSAATGSAHVTRGPGVGTTRGGSASGGGGSARGSKQPERAGNEATTAGANAGSEQNPAEEPVRLPIESVLDLHSFLPREVESVVEEYLIEALGAGFREVRIIHGRGIGTQREIVRAVLARTPFVLSFGDAPPEAGGWGATLAVLDSFK